MDNQPLRLVGAHEIRKMLGVTRQRVYQLAGKSNFPKPVATLRQGKIWLVADIETWMSTHRSSPRQHRVKPHQPKPRSRP